MSKLESKTTVVLGASNKEDRYSNRAIKLLSKYGHPVIPVHPLLDQIDGIPVTKELASVTQPVDTVTLYLNPARGEELIEAIAALHPKRVIMNPGAESELIESRLQSLGISVERACTLVLLQTDQY